MRLLIVEDERGMAEGLRGLLEHQGYAVDLAADGEAGLDCALTGLYDLLILDIMLPELDGLEVLTQLRRAGIETPVLMLTARQQRGGPDPGAGPRRGRLPDQALRHRGTAGPGPGADPAEGHAAGRGPSFGDIRLDHRRLELCRGEERIPLGPKEFLVMECLLVHKNQIVPRNLLCEKVWGLLSEAEYNNVEVYISFLRKKLRALHSEVQIKSIRNAGYHLEVQP